MKNNIFSCKGKTAVVTGGTGLLGFQLVKALAFSGAKVYSADKIRPKKYNSGVNYIDLDITSEKSILSAFKRIGRLDILVNSAYPRTKDWGNKLEKVNFESWKQNMNDQLGGYFLACRTAAERMKKIQSGSIINLSSI